MTSSDYLLVHSSRGNQRVRQDIWIPKEVGADLVSTVIAVLHFATDHDAASFHAYVGVVWKSSSGLAG